MKCFLRTLLGVVLAASSGWAQQAPSIDVPSTKDDVEKLLATMHVRERTQDIMQISRKQTKTLLTDLVNKQTDELSPKQQAQLQSMLDDMIEDVYKDYPVEAILQAMVPIYQKHLTESDVRELITFYSSSTGQKVLREMPAITAEAMQVSYTYIQPRMEEAVKRMKQKMEQMLEQDKKGKAPATQGK
jgi:hypothetical protein